MRKERTLTKKYIECDGCGYALGEKEPLITMTVPFDYPLEFLRDDGTIEFHFHATQQRHDCFRYWAHNPRIMKRTLRERGLDEEQIDEFMSMMLYRGEGKSFSPGVPREKTA